MTQSVGGTRKCPYCAEVIQNEAIVCRFCGRDVKPIPAVPVLQATPLSGSAQVPTKARSHWFRNMSIAALVGVPLTCLVCFAVVMLTPSSPESIATRTARAVAEATDAVLVLTPSRTPVPAATETRPRPTASNTAGPSPTPTETRTPIPTIDMALGMSLTEFTSHYDRLTDLQRDEFIASLPGRTVDWTGTVYDVDDRGIQIDMPGSMWNGYATLRDVPQDVAITINKNSRIRFRATIDQTVEFIFFYIYLVDVEIVGQ